MGLRHQNWEQISQQSRIGQCAIVPIIEMQLDGKEIWNRAEIPPMFCSPGWKILREKQIRGNKDTPSWTRTSVLSHRDSPLWTWLPFSWIQHAFMKQLKGLTHSQKPCDKGSTSITMLFLRRRLRSETEAETHLSDLFIGTYTASVRNRAQTWVFISESRKSRVHCSLYII